MSETNEQAVVIVGGGPTGMMLGAELALAGVDALILERRPDHELDGSRAGGLHSRAIELLDQRGAAGPFLAAGYTAQIVSFGETKLDISDFPTRHPYGLALWQKHIERIMAEWIWDLGVAVRYGQEVVGFAQDDEGVDVALGDGSAIRTRYLIGCDGGRSAIRKGAGIDFPGEEATTSTIVAEAQMEDKSGFGLHRGPLGIGGIGPMEGGETLKIVVPEARLEAGDEPTLDELRDALFVVYGSDFKVHSPTWISRFTDATRQAASYREGRVLLAGDATNIHSPMGGQGIPNGMGDAVNLGWKLAQVVKGISLEDLLDTYQEERHPAVARSVQYTMALNALSRVDPRTEALRDTIAEVSEMAEPRKHLGALASGLGVRYDLGDGHPLLGRRVPDLDLVTAEAPTTIYALLHRARPVLLNLGEPGAFDIGGWTERVHLVDARCEDRWELPAIGEVDSPTALLIRPDGHVAWVGDEDDAGLPDALAMWFGA
ncbi:MAG TPA: FAD-dependent monooxygenase [Solirubrobacterales bacterium]|jgi:2-polyprenyl-6-methoxyphenol hydroxylase-like FAD-dependent oxidoreductase